MLPIPRSPNTGHQASVLASVGRMQFVLVAYRLEHECGAPIELAPTAYRVCRRTDEEGRERLKAMRGVDVLERSDGTLLALFESTYWLDRLISEEPDLCLEKLVAEGDLHY